MGMVVTACLLGFTIGLVGTILGAPLWAILIVSGLCLVCVA